MHDLDRVGIGKYAMKRIPTLIVLACVCLGLLFWAMSGLRKDVIPLPNDVTQVLSNASELELLSLDPNSYPLKLNDSTRFQGWRILGRLTLTSSADRKRVGEAVVRAVAEGGTPTACFDPRHAIHVVQGSQAQSLIICFHCDQIQVYPGKPQAHFLPISKSARPVLDDLLKRAGIPIAPER